MSLMSFPLPRNLTGGSRLGFCPFQLTMPTPIAARPSRLLLRGRHPPPTGGESFTQPGGLQTAGHRGDGKGALGGHP